MTYKSILSDAQIAGLLGIKLDGKGLQDLSALVEIRDFRSSFESALEEELAKAEEEQKKTGD